MSVPPHALGSIGTRPRKNCESVAPTVSKREKLRKAGRVIQILGNNLTGTTSVAFNGTSATFKVISSTYIKAEVPSGATSGTIVVMTPSGTLNSNVPFPLCR